MFRAGQDSIGTAKYFFSVTISLFGYSGAGYFSTSTPDLSFKPDQNPRKSSKTDTNRAGMGRGMEGIYSRRTGQNPMREGLLLPDLPVREEVVEGPVDFVRIGGGVPR